MSIYNIIDITRNHKELNDSYYHRLQKYYPNFKSFSNIDSESGKIRDMIDELENKGIAYEIYEDKKDKGCTIFYEEDNNH